MLRDVELLTNSRMSCARTCLRRHCLRYEYGLRAERDALPLRIGSAFHAGKEADDLGIDAIERVRGFELDPYEEELVVRMLMGHRWRWEKDEYEVIATEQGFELPLRNPETGAPTPNWRIAGKIDRIVRLADGRLALQEYKTTSDDIAPGSDYWVKLRLDQQISLYFLAAREMGFDVQTIVYDVTRKPTLRPSKLPVLDDNKMKIVLDADGARVRTKDQKKWRESADSAAGHVLQTRIETPDEYGERINEEIALWPFHYYQRVEIPRLEQDLEQFRHELWWQQRALREAQLTGRWFRNSSACVTTTYTCEYLGICEQNLTNESPAPNGFVKVENIHPELAPHGQATSI